MGNKITEMQMTQVLLIGLIILSLVGLIYLGQMNERINRLGRLYNDNCVIYPLETLAPGETFIFNSTLFNVSEGG